MTYINKQFMQICHITLTFINGTCPLPFGQKATIYSHRTGENMRTASRSSKSRLIPRTNKTSGKTSASKLSED